MVIGQLAFLPDIFSRQLC